MATATIRACRGGPARSNKGLEAVVFEFEEPVGILEWLAYRCPLRVQRRHKFCVGRADGMPVRVRDGREPA
jgi:hypothetical protein